MQLATASNNTEPTKAMPIWRNWVRKEIGSVEYENAVTSSSSD